MSHPPSDSEPKAPPRAFLTALVERDDYTCQRCGFESEGADVEDLGYYATDDTSDEGGLDLESYVTLCRPCVAAKVDEEQYNDLRGQAPLYPADDAHPAVAHVNSSREDESVTEFIKRQAATMTVLDHWFGKACERCADRFSPETLTVFPAYDPDATQHPGGDCEVVCLPCAKLVVDSCDEPLPAPVLDFEGNEVDIERMEVAPGAAKARSKASDGPLSVTRDSVNLKERMLYGFPTNVLRVLWGPLLTLALIIAGWYVFYDVLIEVGRTITFALPVEAIPIVEGAEVHAFLAILLALTGVVSIAASAVRWGVTWVTGVLWLLVPTVKRSHYRRQVAWRWVQTAHNWVVVYSFLLVLPALFAGALLYGVLDNPSKYDGRTTYGYGGGHKNWAKTAAWYAFYGW